MKSQNVKKHPPAFKTSKEVNTVKILEKGFLDAIHMT